MRRILVSLLAITLLAAGLAGPAGAASTCTSTTTTTILGLYKISGSRNWWDCLDKNADTLDAYISDNLDGGTAESGASTTLTDTDKNWVADIWAGNAVRITGGTGVGQVRKIDSNTATVLTVSSAWATQPDATSTYSILRGPFVTIDTAQTITGAKIFTSNLTATDVSADGTERLRFTEPGGLDFHAGVGSSPLMFDLTDASDNVKRGLEINVRTTNTVGTINTGGILIDIYTPPDNGGDVSGAYIKQTGGGNGISVYNISADRPGGYTEYASQGYAIEAGADGSKNTIRSDVVDGIAFMGNILGTNGQGVTILPSADVSLARRGLRIANAANTIEMYYITLAGDGYMAGSLGLGTPPETLLHIRGTDTEGAILRLENSTPTTGKTYQIGSGDDGLFRLSEVGVADLISIDSSNIGFINRLVRIGQGSTFTLANGADDLGVEGDFEVDGTAQLDGALNLAGLGTFNGGLTVPDGQYAQLGELSAGPPTAADCDADAERFRVALDTTNNRLYFCNGATRAWDYVELID